VGNGPELAFQPAPVAAPAAVVGTTPAEQSRQPGSTAPGQLASLTPAGNSLLGNAATLRLARLAPVGPTRMAGGAAGTTRYRFDGDGDQIPELEIAISPVTGPVGRQIHVVLVQLATGYRHTFDLDLPTMGNPLPAPALTAVTDGRHPTEFALTDMLVLRIYPGQHLGTFGVIYSVAIGVAGEENADVEGPHFAAFPADPTPRESVFSTQGAMRTGEIWSFDVSIGLNQDRFRLSFRQLGGTTVFGLAALDDGKPVGGERADLFLDRPLVVRILDNSGAALSLDLDGDNFANLVLYDRLTVPAAETLEKEKGRDPFLSKLSLSGLYRDHEIFAEGPSLPQGHTFHFAVREGRTLPSTRPRGEFDRAAASDLKAVTGLAEQRTIGTFADKRGQLRGELATIEQQLGALRRWAKDEQLISAELYSAWDRLSQTFIMLDVLRATGKIDAAFSDKIAENADRFAALFEKETERAVRTVSPPEGGSVTYINEYTGRIEVVALFVDHVHEPSKEVAASARRGDWDDAIKEYRALTTGLDRWVAHQNRTKYGEAELARPETMRGVVGERLAGQRAALLDLERSAPTRVAAVLHPAESYYQTGEVAEYPLSLYYWHDDKHWYVKDLTNPADMPRWSVPVLKDHDGNIPEEPPDTLFAALDEGPHFPKGTIHWLLPSGRGGQVETSGPSTLRAWLTGIGFAAAAVGLGMVTMGAGTVAVVGGYVLAGSALVGAGMATYDLIEGFRHDTMTPGRFLLDVAQIVQAVAGLGALRMGQILVGARAAAAGGLAVEATTGLKLANRFFVPLRGAELGATGVTLAVMTEELSDQIQQIQDGGAPYDEKYKAYAMLIGQFAFTVGLSALAIKGAIPELTAGRSISIEVVNGIEYAVPVGTSVAGAEVNTSRAKVMGAEGAADLDAHLVQIRSSIGGDAGNALADVEAMALRPDADGNLSVDAAGRVSRAGVEIGTLEQLQGKVAAANNAGAAHGTDTAYVVDLSPPGGDGLSRVQVKATPRAGAEATPSATLRGILASEPGRVAELADVVEQLRALEPASRLEIRPDGTLRLNGQVDISAARLKGMKPKDIRTLLRRTRELDALSGSKRTDLLEYRWLSAQIRGVYTADQVAEVTAHGRKLGLNDKQIVDLLETGSISKPSKKKEPLSVEELKTQMSAWVLVVKPSGRPILFDTAEQFAQFKAKLLGLLERYKVPRGRMVVQGSSLRTSRAADVDIGIFVSDEEFAAYAKQCRRGILSRASNPQVAANIVEKLQGYVDEGFIPKYYFDYPEGAATFGTEVRATLENDLGAEIDISVMRASSEVALYPELEL
jgi:hypothetical protein